MLLACIVLYVLTQRSTVRGTRCVHLLGSVYSIQLDAEVMRVRTWFSYLGKLKGIAPNSTAGSFDTSHHVALGVRMSSRGTVFIGNFVKNRPSGWEVEVGT